MNNCYYITPDSVQIPYSRGLFSSEMVFVSFVDRNGSFLDYNAYLERLVLSAENFWNLDSSNKKSLTNFVKKSWGDKPGMSFNQYYRLSLVREGEDFLLYFQIEPNKFFNIDKKLQTIELQHWSEWGEFKLSNYADRYLFKQKLNNSFNDYLRINSNGDLLETSSSNIFFSKNNQIFTPIKTKEFYAGVTRSIFIKNIKTYEKKIQLNELDSFNGCFILNGVRGIEKVLKVNQTEFENKILNEIEEKFNNIWNKS